MKNESDEWRRGWPTVFSGFAGVVFMTAVPTVTGLVMAPLMAEFGWSRAIITSNVLICSIFSMLLAPTLGSLIARFGVRRCALTAVIAAAPALGLISLTGGSPVTWIAAWTLFAVINVGISPMVWSGAVAALFDRARGMALAVTLSGSGVAYFVFPPLAVAVLQTFGWRAVYLVIAALMIVVLLPLVYALFRGPLDLNGARTPQPGLQAAGPSEGFTLSQALHTRQFWQFIAVSALMALAEGAMHVHLFPIFQEGGLTAASAAWVASFMGIAMIVGRILTGFMQDRFSPLPVFGFSILIVLVSCVALRFFNGEVGMGLVASICLGLGTGGTTIGLANLTSRYFGLAAYPSIFGLLMGGFSLGYGIAPVVAGHFREVTASYVPIFDWLAAALVIAAISVWLIGKPGMTLRAA